MRRQRSSSNSSDVDELELHRYYGSDAPDHIAEAVQDHLDEDGDPPAWLVERAADSEYRAEATSYDVCPTHGRIKEALYGERVGEFGCGACWLAKREAARG